MSERAEEASEDKAARRDHAHDPDRIDQELLAEHQGAESPLGDEVPPVPVERHGRHWVVHDPRAERNDTDWDTDRPS